MRDNCPHAGLHREQEQISNSESRRVSLAAYRQVRWLPAVPQEGWIVRTVTTRYRTVLSSVCGLTAFSLGGLLFTGCGSSRPPTIQFTEIPDAGPGGAEKM